MSLLVATKLLFAHALGDYALQTAAMTHGKNRHSLPQNVPIGQKIESVWFPYLFSHALINGAMFYLFTNNIQIGIAETVVHFIIDFLKCDNRFGPTMDQIYHYFCIMIYMWVLA